MSKISLIIISLFVALSAKAETDTILVTDIDDTLKVQNVLDLVDSASYVLDSKTRFMGMNDLFQALAHDNPAMKFYYVSRAPSWLMADTHRSFLWQGKFPQGEYIPRTEYSLETHKVLTISKTVSYTHLTLPTKA